MSRGKYARYNVTSSTQFRAAIYYKQQLSSLMFFVMIKVLYCVALQYSTWILGFPNNFWWVKYVEQDVEIWSFVNQLEFFTLQTFKSTSRCQSCLANSHAVYSGCNADTVPICLYTDSAFSHNVRTSVHQGENSLTTWSCSLANHKLP